MTEVTLIDGTTIKLNTDNIVFGTEEVDDSGNKIYKYLLVPGTYIATSTEIQ